MTKLTRVIERETAAVDRGRPVCIALHPKHLELRLKGTRETYEITWEAIWWAAAKAASDKARTEKLLARKTKPRP